VWGGGGGGRAPPPPPPPEWMGGSIMNIEVCKTVETWAYQHPYVLLLKLRHIRKNNGLLWKVNRLCICYVQKVEL
jgi:hypothetical protein